MVNGSGNIPNNFEKDLLKCHVSQLYARKISESHLFALDCIIKQRSEMSNCIACPGAEPWNSLPVIFCNKCCYGSYGCDKIDTCIHFIHAVPSQ